MKTTKLKCIQWKPRLGGIFIIGFVDGKERFTVDNLELYDRTTEHRYPMRDTGGKPFGKILAKDLINGLNKDAHEKLRLDYAHAREKEGERMSKLFAEADALIKKLSK